MSNWEQPINSRTQNDIDKVRFLYSKGYANLSDGQKAEWLSGLIGAFNARDANRVENNIGFLNDLLNIKGVTTKTNWSMYDIFGEEDATRCVSMLDNLVERFNLEDAPNIPSLPLNVYTKINDIETLLSMMYEKWMDGGRSYLMAKNGEYMLTSSSERINVLNKSKRGRLLTNSSEIFVTTDGALLVFKNKI